MLLTPLVAAALSASGPSPLVLHDCEFGEAYAYARVECTALIENAGDHDLALRIVPEPADPSVDAVLVDVPAKGRVDVQLRAQLANHIGQTVKSFLVSEEGGERPAQRLQATGFVLSALDEFRPRLDFGSVDAADETSMKLALSSRETADFRILRVLEKPDQLDVQILPDGRSIEASIRGDAAWGVLNDGIRLAIDTPRQKEAWVAVQAEVHGPVVPSWNPVFFGVLAAGREQTAQLSELRRPDGQPLEVGTVKVEGIEGTAEAAACSPASESCRVLRLTIGESQPPGMAEGKIIVELPQFKRSLFVGVQGLLTQPATAASSDAEGADQSSGPSETPQARVVVSKPEEQPTQGTKTEDAGANEAAVHPASPPPQGEGPLLKWAVRDESSVHGYQIFRASSEEGPFVLINATTIAPHLAADSASVYQWRDTSADRDRVYWYYVGVVYNDGRKERITPDMRSRAVSSTGR